jgi:hypothetical protein
MKKIIPPKGLSSPCICGILHMYHLVFFLFLTYSLCYQLFLVYDCDAISLEEEGRAVWSLTSITLHLVIVPHKSAFCLVLILSFNKKRFGFPFRLFLLCLTSIGGTDIKNYVDDTRNPKLGIVIQYKFAGLKVSYSNISLDDIEICVCSDIGLTQYQSKSISAIKKICKVLTISQIRHFLYKVKFRLLDSDKMLTVS